jgi:tetratricopeptide (TPR) repeat protein
LSIPDHYSWKFLIFAAYMTVKEVFDLRKQGRIEEAYEVIRPMYAVHKGKYTTLCMFWTASDILKKRVREGRLDEAEKIFAALQRILPNIEDKDGRALSSMLYEAVTLDREIKTFSMLDFVAWLRVEQLCEKDWETVTAPAVAGTPSHPIPSVAQRLLTCAFREIQEEPTVDNALKAMPLLQEAVRRYPRNKNCLRYMAMVYRLMGEREKAASIYQQIEKYPTNLSD